MFKNYAIIILSVIVLLCLVMFLREKFDDIPLKSLNAQLASQQSQIVMQQSQASQLAYKDLIQTSSCNMLQNDITTLGLTCDDVVGGAGGKRLLDKATKKITYTLSGNLASEGCNTPGYKYSTAVTGSGVGIVTCGK